MDTIAGLLRYAERVDLNSFDDPPADHFSIYPLYASKSRAEAVKASADFTENWKRACKADKLHEKGLDFQGCTTRLGHYVHWGYADTVPGRIVGCAEACDYAYFWDDVTDIISMEKNQEITQDLAVSMLTELQSGKPVEPKLEINKLGVKIVRDLIDKDHDKGLDKVISWKAHLDSQSKSTHNDMSFEQYTTHRFSEVGAMWAVELGCWSHDIHLTKEEKASVQYLIQICLTGGMLGNDYYSFNKEFDEHQRTSTLNRMQNALSLLMRDYGYTEDEARSILRKEIQRREQQFLDGFETWSRRAGPEQTELRRYLALVLVLVSGTMFWMSHAERYHRADLTTTAEDRATIVGKSHGALRVLDGYPPPKGLKRVSSSLEPSTLTMTTNNKKRLPVKPNSASRDSNGNGNGDGVQRGQDHPAMASYTASFQRAPSNICDAPYEYINSLQSKNMRNRFIDALNIWLRVPASSLQVIKHIVQMLHNSSLMLDDIEDTSSLRRGQPATHVFYGTSQTINSANFTYVKAVHEITKLHNPKCLEIFIDELSNLHRGQSLDLHWRHHARCPTTDEYITMVDNKTGSLFRLMLRLMEAESPTSLLSNTTLARLLTLIGRYYQIRDDYMNLTSNDYISKKGFCEDLDEGKFSLPLIHLLNHTEYPDRITSAIYNRVYMAQLKREVKSHILDAMETSGTFEYTRGVLGHIHEELMRTLDEVEDRLGANNGARMLILGLRFS